MTPSTKEVRPHDFRRTDLLERQDLQTLHGLSESFTRAATQRLSSILHRPCSFELSSMDQVMWRDLAEEFQGKMHHFTFSMAPLVGRGVLAIPTDEVLAFVDLRLAGSGDDDFTGRAPSEIDKAFLAPIITELIIEFAKTMTRIQTITPLLEAQDDNVEGVSIAAPQETCVVIRMALTTASRPAREIVLCLPYPMVRLLFDLLQARSVSSGEDRDDSFSHDTRRRLHEVPLELVFQFPSFITTPAQLLTLRVGDSLGLGHPKGRPLEVRVEGLLVGLADMCSSGVHKACEIKEEVAR
ncbi:MAG: FliM/FliN family flagellar motor switch protein [Acidimicrobiales bacterium]